MPQPHPFPCGGVNQPACPPEPAVGFMTLDPAKPLYSREDMARHGAACYAKGAADHAAALTRRVPRVPHDEPRPEDL